MEERTRQFKEASENVTLTGSSLTKEINTLRKFLFRNQDHRFTKSEQQYLFMAVCTHCNTFLKSRPDEHETNVIGLVDDALKMPFTVFTTQQKEKMLLIYYNCLGESEKKRSGGASGVPAAPLVPTGPREVQLDVLDVDQQSLELQLLQQDTGDEYPYAIVVKKGVMREIKKLFDEGKEIVVTVKEEDGEEVPPMYVKYVCKD